LIAGKLDVDPEQALRMKVLGVYDTTDHKLKNDPFVSDGCLYMIQASSTTSSRMRLPRLWGFPH